MYAPEVFRRQRAEPNRCQPWQGTAHGRFAIGGSCPFCYHHSSAGFFSHGRWESHDTHSYGGFDGRSNFPHARRTPQWGHRTGSDEVCRYDDRLRPHHILGRRVSRHRSGGQARRIRQSPARTLRKVLAGRPEQEMKTKAAARGLRLIFKCGFPRASAFCERTSCPPFSWLSLLLSSWRASFSQLFSSLVSSWLPSS